MKIFVIPIEPIDNRYTKQWYENIPLLIKNYNNSVDVVTIDGDPIPNNTTSGAFLDFAATNYYKASQAAKISQMFMNGEVNAGDRFLVTDAWNFVITPIKYSSELLDIPVEIHSIWHAGAYDPSDILGMKMSKMWPENTERSWFYASDANYFATDFHKNMFLKNLEIPAEYQYKAIKSGQPHELIVDSLESLSDTVKEKTVIWPHRYNADKQPDIIEDISLNLPVTITQKLELKKSDYYKKLAKSQVIFSCSLHENLGISVMEAVLCNTIPVLPDRCSYSEMYYKEFLYPSEWTKDYNCYQKHKQDLLDFINERMQNSEKYSDILESQKQILKTDYLSSKTMIENLLNGN